MIETCQQHVDRRLSEGWRIAGRFRHSVYLSPPDGSFIRPVDLRNDVETLRPNAAGDSTEWICVGGETNYQMVDEVSQDGDTTYVKEWASGEKDLYNIANHSVGSGTINFVRLYAWLKRYSASQTRMHIGIKSGTTEDWGSEIATTDSWVEHTRQFNTDPDTDIEWSWVKVDALQIGVKAGEGDWLGGACTQIYVEVDYTPLVTEYEKLKSAHVGLAPSVSREVGKPLSSHIGLTPAWAREIGKTQSSLIGLTSSLVRSIDVSYMISAGNGLISSLARLVSPTRVRSVTAGIVGTIGYAVTLERTISATAGLANAILRVVPYMRTLLVSAGLVDKVKRGFEERLKVAEGLVSTTVRSTSMLRRLAFCFHLKSIAQWPGVYIKDIEVLSGLKSSFTRNIGVQRFFTTAVGLVGRYVRGVGLRFSTTLGEVVVRTKGIGRGLLTGIGLSSSVTMLRGFTRAFSSALGLVSIRGRLVGFVRKLPVMMGLVSTRARAISRTLFASSGLSSSFSAIGKVVKKVKTLRFIGR